LYFIASFPFRFATRFATITGRREKLHGPLGVDETPQSCGSFHYTDELGDRCVGTQPALLGKISVRFKPATQGQMHDLRQRHYPIITPTLRCPKLADVRDSSLVALSIGVQSSRKK
jgi:hypothetical protein